MRLTEELGNGIYDFVNTNYAFNVSEGANKLGKLEDILEKYCIDDLEVLDKRLNNGVKQFTQMDYGKREWQDYYKIEKEIGIDLVTLFKALKNGIYYKFGNGDITKTTISCIRNNCVVWYADFNLSVECFFKDYGKTWALTKEELL